MATDNMISENYVVGQVAGSLFQKQKTKKKANPLASLFSSTATAAKPVFLPVQESNVCGRKRRFSEESDTEKNNKQTKSKKVGPPIQKVLTAAERRLAERERALSTADEEDKKIKNTKQKRNKKRALGSASETVTGDGETVLTGPQHEKGIKPSARKKTGSQAVEKIKNKRTLFVGNLPSECTKQVLVSLFNEFGAIETVRFRSVARAEPTISRKLATIQRNIHPKRTNLNAYVVFKAEDDALKAVKRNGHEIKKGFHIRVDLASQSNVHDHGKSIFIGNLSYEIEENQVRQHFSDCGPIESIRIVRDRESGMGKGFGYVLFQNTDAVTLALKLDSSKIQGRKVRVSRSVNKHSQSGATRGASGKSGRFRHKIKTPAGGKGGSFPPKTFTGMIANPAEKNKVKGQKSNAKQKKAGKFKTKQ